MTSGLTYILKSSIYVSLTNRCNAVPLIKTRGPSFTMPAASGFSPLPSNDEPTAEQVADAVSAALSGVEAKEVCFAGVGEPLLRRRCLEDAAKLIRKASPDLALRLNTNGLVADSEAKELASSLRAIGFSGTTVALATADAAQYTELMKPEPIRLSPVMSIPMGHSEVTGFIAACVAEGLNVECSAVARPEVDLDATAALAKSLGATFRERSWHP